ncbi:receptor-type tyrosine-protein phosphatase C precursor [Ictalurus punctatus]|uniref:Receptor-type tyrosine-protein phosphatase C n=1 Tax=Ictalurus punctatus TaxID=7998 RepID=Q6UNF4_ICTPU|nr:receptor-type tyrosine-protein phosphatase C precursor [Ictalurus punctatus]AAQ72837.1 CD45 [Ictalurus punctatus]
MAKFHGPRFLFLVLAGLVLCKQGHTETSFNSSTQSTPAVTPPVSLASTQGTADDKNGPENSSASTSDSARTSSPMNPISPPLTTSTATENSSTSTFDSARTSSTMNTTSPPLTTSTATEIIKANTSVSPRTSSTMNTISPPLTTSTAKETSPKCSYTLEEENDTVTVKIDKNDPAVKYKIKFTDTSDGSSTEESFPISLKSFKPCQNYNVTLTPPCKPMTGFFKTRELVDSDVNHTLNITGAKVQVCFETKWDLSKCIDLNTSNSCTSDYSVTFKGDPCKKSIPFTLPSVKPVINYTNEFPTELRWDNRPSNCLKDLTYNCNGSAVAEFKDLKPFHNHNCTGTYDYGNGTITSDPVPVKIDCDIVNEPSLSVSHNSIHASWQLNSENCASITTDFIWNVTCKEHGSTSSLKGHCTKNSCEFSNLKSFTEYTCEFVAAYGDISFNTTTKTTKTWPGQPFAKTQTTKVESHNAFKVSCSINSWNGDPGKIFAELYINDHLEDNKTDCNGMSCDFHFTNLYYLTKYTIKVYAQNGNGNRTVILDVDHSTKYNDKAVIGFLAFLIVLTSVALLFVLYKIYLLKREKSRNDQELDDLLPTNALLRVEPMSAEALLEAYKKKRADEGRLFMEEFQSVPRIFSNYSVREAKKPENQPKNRYVDILPYDYNRVTLSHGGTDYINASFIEGYKESNKYIAAQGPKEETVGDFWAMIWEQKTSIIVMVTRCEEGNKNKCAQYWPSMDRETEIFEDLVVKIKGEENCPDYIIRHLTMMNRKEKAAEREVTHIQFTSWPDHGVPSDPGLLLKLRRRVNSFKNFFSGPIVIHCSAGVGRTGTYIGIDAMIESLEAEGRVDIYGYVVKLRRQRCLMVQVEAQYVLIHMALIEYSQFGETEMSLADFHSEVNTLRQKEGNETSLMDLEFQKLPKFRNYRASNTARTEENNKKNRSSIVPYDFNRVPIKVDDEASHDSEAEDEDEYSSDEEDEVPTKYINASYVDGYWCPSSFIVAQGPMPDTVADFLHMLYQKKVKTVFMLSDCIENDQEMCAQYWDDEKKTFGEMVVEVKETENFPTYIRRCLEIQHTKRKDSQTLQQYHFLKWVGHEIPQPLDLVDMMKSARQSGVNSSKNNNLPIVVHCNDGSSRSGIFCALWKLLDSADTEKLVDIFQVAKDLRKARLGMINTLEQYEFLYAALEAAYPVQNGEVKKPSEAPADSVQIINESTALIPTNPSTDAEHQESTKEKPSEESTKEKPSEESTKEGTDSTSPEEGVTESSSEPEKALSENTTNGPTATVEV